MKTRLRKFITGAGYTLLTWLLIVTVLDRSRDLGSTGLVLVSISLAALGLTLLRVREYCDSLEDRMTLRLVFIPLAVNVALSLVATLVSQHVGVWVLAGLSIAGWSVVLLVVKRAFSGYIRFGRGHLPADVWINPPVEVLQPGDAILVHGPMADFVREAVGHTETVVRFRDGRLSSFSFMIESGPVWQPATRLVQSYIKGGYDYIVLRLRTPLTEDQNVRAEEIVAKMCAENCIWTESARRRLRGVLDWLPLSAARKEKLQKRFWPTGYDTIGKYWGNRRDGRWTCIGANIELMSRLGVPMRSYGTGVFGLCGAFNPILPIRILRDPCYRWLTVEDRHRYLAETAS